MRSAATDTSAEEGETSKLSIMLVCYFVLSPIIIGLSIVLIPFILGDVNYTVDEFTDKNKDTLFPDLIDCMQTSGNDFISHIFPEEPQATTGRTKKRPTTAGFKLKNSCGVLMKTLSSCEPHYIR